jgi:hypothetical protein
MNVVVDSDRSAIDEAVNALQAAVLVRAPITSPLS